MIKLPVYIANICSYNSFQEVNICLENVYLRQISINVLITYLIKKVVKILKGVAASSGDSTRRRNGNILGKRNGLRDIIDKR